MLETSEEAVMLRNHPVKSRAVKKPVGKPMKIIPERRGKTMIIIDQERCVKCNECIDECHENALFMEDDVLKCNEEACNGCGHCMALCPKEAMMLDGDGYDVGDVEEFNTAARPKELHIREMIMMRRSVRDFTDAEISDEDLEKILDAGRYAPTGMNAQGNVFLAAKDPVKKDKFVADVYDAFDRISKDVLAGKSAAIPEGLAKKIQGRVKDYRDDETDHIFYKAPLIIFCFSDSPQNGAIAALTMGNMAYGLRLGYCLLGFPCIAFQDEELRKKYNIPDGKVCALALAIGEPAVEFFCSVPRKKPETIIL